MKATIQRRTSALIAMAVAIAFGLMALVAVPAHAASEPGPGDLVTGNIDAEKTGSLTIHKLKLKGATQNATGWLQDVTQEGLNGITFKIQKFDVDLTTSAGWAQFAGHDCSTKPDNIDFDTSFGTNGAMEKTTANDGTDDGIAKFSDLPVGMYYVTETDIGNNIVTAPSQPFCVSIPMKYPISNDATTDPTNGTWLYNVHAYPKNSIDTPTKKVSAPDKKQGGQDKAKVTWTIEAPIPGGSDLTHFAIGDKIDSRLAMVEDSVKLKVAPSGSDQFTELSKDSDFTVTLPAAGNENKLTVNLADPAGLTKINANKNGRIQLSYKTYVTDKGYIPNHAQIFVNDPEYNNGIDTNETQTKWGKLIITKKSDEAKNVLLAGAEFTVYLPTENTCGPNVPEATSPGFVGTMTTGTDGKAEMILAAKHTSDDGNQAPAEAGRYCVKETKAPAGYTLDSDTIHDVTIGADGEASLTVEKTVINTQHVPPRMPVTGAAGTALLIIVGLSIISLAVGTAIRTRRGASIDA